MRPFRLVVPGILVIGAAMHGQGLPPRAAASDYEVHRTGRDGTIAAAILPPDQVARIFSADVGRHYVVVGIGVYPENGNAVDLLPIDFALTTAGERSYPAAPADVAWRGKRATAPPDRSAGLNVISEAGVAYGTRTNPATGRTEKGLETWEGASVDNAPRPNSRPVRPTTL